MPKERVQHGELRLRTERPESEESPGGAVEVAWRPGDPVPEGSMLIERPSIDVTWNREGGWVQIGFEAPRAWWDDFYASYQGSAEQHHFNAWSEVFDRKDLNHMIRTLRRARDAAYGADE